MTITLSPELEAVVREDLQAGLIDSVDEYVADAIQIFHERLLPTETMEETRAKFELGWKQAQGGELMSEEDFLEERKAKKSAWMAKHRTA